MTQWGWQHPPNYVTFWSRGHVTNVKPYISPSAMPMTTKIGRLITYSGEPHLQSHMTFWLRDFVMWQMKKTYLHLRNTYGYQTWQHGNLRLEDPMHEVTLLFWSYGHVTNVKPCIWISAISMATKLGRVKTYIGGNTSTNSHIFW